MDRTRSDMGIKACRNWVQFRNTYLSLSPWGWTVSKDSRPSPSSNTEGCKQKWPLQQCLGGSTYSSFSLFSYCHMEKMMSGVRTEKAKQNKTKTCEEHDGLIERVELNHAIGLKASLPRRYGSFLKQSASNCSTPWKHNTNEEAQISTAVTMILFPLISFQKTIHLIKINTSLPLIIEKWLRLYV